MAIESNTQLYCPYCRAEVAESDARCDACQIRFPWAVRDEQIEQTIKERETSTLRATMTLAAEVYAYARGGQPPSFAAMKGFLTAWLFPRVIIAVGSILATAVLVAQTAIIWRQTQLLEVQADAAQLDRVERLRARVSRFDKHINNLSSMKRGLQAMERAAANCDTGCQNEPMISAIQRLLPKRRSTSAQRPSAGSTWFVQLKEAMNESGGWATGEIRGYVTDAGLDCLVESKLTESVIASANAIIDANNLTNDMQTFGGIGHLGPAHYYEDPTKTAESIYTSARALIAATNDPVTVVSLSSFVVNNAKSGLVSVDTLVMICSKLRDFDVVLLSKIEPSHIYPTR